MVSVHAAWRRIRIAGVSLACLVVVSVAVICANEYQAKRRREFLAAMAPYINARAGELRLKFNLSHPHASRQYPADERFLDVLDALRRQVEFCNEATNDIIEGRVKPSEVDLRMADIAYCMKMERDARKASSSRRIAEALTAHGAKAACDGISMQWDNNKRELSLSVVPLEHQKWLLRVVLPAKDVDMDELPEAVPIWLINRDREIGLARELYCAGAILGDSGGRGAQLPTPIEVGKDITIGVYELGKLTEEIHLSASQIIAVRCAAARGILEHL